jgi:hypothetical protein
MPFTLDADGNLVGTWGPDSGFPVKPGYNVSTTFDVTVADGAPLGDYTVTLALIDVDEPEAVLAQETGTVTVHANEAFVLWGAKLPKYTSQGLPMTLPVQVYAPAAGSVELTLTVTGPGDDPQTTDVVEATAPGDVRVYGSNGTDMVSMPLTMSADGRLVGTWDASVVAGYTPVTWYVTVAEGALVGNYAFGVGLEGGNALDSILVVVFPAESHGEQPPSTGDDRTPPVVQLGEIQILDGTATFPFTANETPVDFECMLSTDGIDGDWAPCASPMEYTGLAPGDYVFSVVATDKALNVSNAVTHSWTVADTTAPSVAIELEDTAGDTARFEFAADESDVTFECRLTKDGVDGDWEGCGSPKTYAQLVAGSYLFSVRGADAAGNVSDIAESQSWTVAPPVDQTPPTVTVAPVGTPGATATFQLTASEPGVTFECQLTKDGRVSQAWAPCTSEKTYTALKPATYVLSARGTDLAGNVSTGDDIGTSTWTVTKAPSKSK